jgi:hypothetical protein
MNTTKSNKELDDQIKRLTETYESQKGKLRLKTDETLAQRLRNENLQYDLQNMLKASNYSDWPYLLKDLYNKHFIKNGDPLMLVPKQIYNQRMESTPITSEQSQEKKENAALQDELLKQRNCVAEKLHSVAYKTDKQDKQRKELIQRLQSENVDLINDCNNMRDENKKISKRVNTLEKKFKEITGISLANIENIEQELDTFAKTSYSSRAKGAFQKSKSQPKGLRVKSFVDSGKLAIESPQKIKDMLAKNKEQIMQQNEDIKSIQVIT